MSIYVYMCWFLLSRESCDLSSPLHNSNTKPIIEF